MLVWLVIGLEADQPPGQFHQHSSEPWVVRLRRITQLCKRVLPLLYFPGQRPV